MIGDGDMYDAPSLVGKDDQNKQQAARRGRYHEEIRGHHLPAVICQERAPRLGRRATLANHIFRNGRLINSDPTFTSSPWIRGAPQRGLASDIVRISVRTS